MVAARGAATEIMMAQGGGPATYYTGAAADGQTIGRNHLSAFPLSPVAIAIDYHDDARCPESGTGWYGSQATTNTRCVRAKVSGTFNMLFMKVVGLRGIDLERLGFSPMAIVRVGGVLPLGICESDLLTRPLGPWTLWSPGNGNNFCGINRWAGMIDLNKRGPGCPQYYEWIQPEPPSGPPPARAMPRCWRPGATVRI
jgi:hypothetical protein